ncbi:MAG: hypothetical protein ACRCS0_15825 [Albidovulum sp.]
MTRKCRTLLCSAVIDAALGTGAVGADAAHMAHIADGNRGIGLAIAKRYSKEGATNTSLPRSLHVGGGNRMI